MQIELTPEPRDFVRRAMDEGRVKRAEDAVQQGLELWIERERRRDEILAAIDEAEASLARGEGRVITEESMRQLAEKVHQRGLARLQAEKSQRQKRRDKWRTGFRPRPRRS
jgi:Arc/MetJ-type ribon-helix-helix transcriptional regulator